MDSHNLPDFDNDQFEGRLDKPISSLSLIALASFFFLIMGVYSVRAWTLQIKNGDAYTQRSENNRLRHTPLFASRGVIYDRNGVELAWNSPSDDPDISFRKYSNDPGLSHVVGYVQYPSKDSSGFYYKEDFEGIDGVEYYFDKILQGKNGSKLIEVNARGIVQSGNVVKAPKQGENITLSIDSKVQSLLFKSIKDIANKVGFVGGSGVIMDVNTGEVIAMTNYPEFKSEIMSEKKDVLKIKEYLTDKNKPFLDRAVSGLYTPGSIIKPFMALGALNEKIIDPLKKIESNGSISVQNDYNPELQTIFKDWKVHGMVDMRRAIAVSSDVYFYTIGGGYKNQKGLGIAKIDKYMQVFGFGEKIEDSFFTGANGTVPTPEWKKRHFNGESWRLGNTYHTVIGQYGFQASPIQIVRAISAIATNGVLRDPTIIKGETGKILRTIDIPKSYFDVIHEGMRLTTLEGTARPLDVNFVKVATKTGTAELGSEKKNVNSLVVGYFPYENPHYAFVVIMEKGAVINTIGAVAVMKEVLYGMSTSTPEYFR